MLSSVVRVIAHKQARHFAVMEKVYEFKVKDDNTMRQFYLEIPMVAPDPPERAYIEYRKLGCDKYELLHTFVPPSAKGKKIGESLAKSVLKHLSEKEVHASLKCSFLKKKFQEISNGDAQMKKYVKIDRSE